jgi:UDP-3-O-[3-hydroxymyristoyl] N-acetylglucosamine deacetylase
VADAYQTTLHKSISCAGVGLHSGSEIHLTLHPAPADSGITFVRSDLAGVAIPALYDLVTDTKLGTSLARDGVARVATVEHLMAALWGCGIDNVTVELDGPEVPVMDGSSEPFVFLIECAGIETQDVARRSIRVLRPVSVEGEDKRITVHPADALSVRFEIDFENPVVGCQSYDFIGIDGLFKTELSRARTFGFEAEVAAMHEAGLARGGSLDNAVVIGADRVLNEDGLRFRDEFVRHKVLDCLGDLFLAGARIIGRVDAVRAGHGLNNALLRTLFADRSNWCFDDETPAQTPERVWADRAVAAIA